MAQTEAQIRAKRKWRQTHREQHNAWNKTPKAKAYRKAYRERTKEIMREYQKKYRAEHREELRIKKKAWSHEFWLKNRDRIKEKLYERRRQNPEIARRYQRKVRLLHPAEYRAKAVVYTAKRRAIKLGASVDGEKVASLIRRWRSEKRFTCYYCQSRFPVICLDIDHIVPLSRGGLHCVSNLCRSCKNCNARKHAKAISELNLRQPLLSL